MIHTVAGLIPVFDSLARLHFADWTTFNMLDESLLRTTIREGHLSQVTMRRLVGMVWSAVDAGASAVVVTCSSLGPAVEAARPICPVPLFRIDDGMARAAVAAGRRIGVLATLDTTLEPTTALIRQTAAQHAADVTVVSQVSEGAFALLQGGDAAGHDARVANSLRAMAPEVDVIVLAQASMARALEAVRADLGATPVLTSPELGMAQVRACLTPHATTGKR
jgi:Asp/Glu/hydantoin racemase